MGSPVSESRRRTQTAGVLPRTSRGRDRFSPPRLECVSSSLDNNANRNRERASEQQQSVCASRAVTDSTVDVQPRVCDETWTARRLAPNHGRGPVPGPAWASRSTAAMMRKTCRQTTFSNIRRGKMHNTSSHAASQHALEVVLVLGVVRLVLCLFARRANLTGVLYVFYLSSLPFWQCINIPHSSYHSPAFHRAACTSASLHVATRVSQMHFFSEIRFRHLDITLRNEKVLPSGLCLILKRCRFKLNTKRCLE